MNSRPEAEITIIQAELQTERAVLEECILSYDRLIGLLREDPERPIVLSGGSDRSAAIAKIEKLEALLRKAAIPSADLSQPKIRASRGSFGRLRRPIQYGTVVLAISVAIVVGWWMYGRPVRLTCARLQGSWQQFDMTDAGETERQYYRTFEGDNLTTFSYVPYDDTWHTYGRRVELIPVTGFFELKITGLPGDRPVAGAEFYIRIDGDKINEIRGIHRLDPMHKTEINLWRRVDSVPRTTRSNGMGG